jgi:hypothetical protein
LPVKDWEIIADNLREAGWSWGCVSQLLIWKREQSGLLTHTEMMERALLCTPTKSSALLWNSNRRSIALPPLAASELDNFRFELCLIADLPRCPGSISCHIRNSGRSRVGGTVFHHPLADGVQAVFIFVAFRGVPQFSDNQRERTRCCNEKGCGYNHD